MDPAFLGRITCFDSTNQCMMAEEQTYKLMTNTKLDSAFEGACQNRKGSMIRCCPLNLINTPYQPKSGAVPIHVKDNGNGSFTTCPEELTSSCVNEQSNDRFTTCIAQKCNDAGYLEADNYYQVCKAYNLKGNSEQVVPDCPKNNCSSMITLPQWYLDTLQGKPIPTPTSTPTTTSTTLITPSNNLSNLSLSNITWNLMNTDIYTYSSIVMGVIAMIIIFAIIFI